MLIHMCIYIYTHVYTYAFRCRHLHLTSLELVAFLPLLFPIGGQVARPPLGSDLNSSGLCWISSVVLVALGLSCFSCPLIGWISGLVVKVPIQPLLEPGGSNPQTTPANPQPRVPCFFFLVFPWLVPVIGVHLSQQDIGMGPLCGFFPPLCQTANTLFSSLEGEHKGKGMYTYVCISIYIDVYLHVYLYMCLCMCGIIVGTCRWPTSCSPTASLAPAAPRPVTSCWKKPRRQKAACRPRR